MRVGFPVLPCVLLIAACSAGGGPDAAGGGGGLGGGAGSSNGGSSSGGSAGAATGGGSGGGGTGATGGIGGTGGAGGSGTGATGGGGTGATGGTSACPATNTCATALDLGTLSGDTGTQSFVQSGYQTTFFSVRVTEDNHSVIGDALSLSLSLDVPSGADYDVYAYLNPNLDASPCGSAPFGKADTGGTGVNESTKLDWGDGLTGSGSNDSRDVVIEVRHKSGTCDAAETWSLIVAGNV